jgi:enoyl-CoA hydratase
MASYKNLLVSSEGGALTVTINRPDKLNALSIETVAELTAAFQAARADASIRCAILTGAGDKAFVAGADISEFGALSPATAKEFSARGNALISLIENLGKPVIACLNGYALGGGCELALGCTLRVASEKAVLGQPEIALGIMPGFGGSQRLARLCGKGRAMELCLLGDRIPAQRAFELGIVNFVWKHEELREKTRALADRIVHSAPVAVQYILEAVNRGAECSLDESLAYESNLFALCFATEDMREGTRAFLEKRKAQFKGA